MEKELEGLEEGQKTKIHLVSLWATLKKKQIEKYQATIPSMDSKKKKDHITMRKMTENDVEISVC